uniref:ribonuclease H n=1 Tax=Poeciliopsis prolifica TaxID=188132 RepID=A0A0S7EQV5_9TELE
MQVKPHIKEVKSGLRDYNGQSIECIGTCQLNVTVKGTKHLVFFSVVKEDRESLLGDKSCEELGLVKRVYHINTEFNESNNPIDAMLRDYEDVFRGLGSVPCTYKIQLREGAQPVVHAARRIPAPLREGLKNELDRMIRLGVIQKVEEPTDWVNSIVITKKKNGELRICMDPKDLNENIRREHYQIPTREEIISEMSGASYFTKLDASQGFWQVKLDESSTKYCTFNTPFGRYCFLRLPFGIKSAPEIFHRAMERIIEGLNGVRVYIDDIIIWGSTVQEHNDRLRRVMERIRKNGLKLNKNKCEFCVKEILFLGDKLSGRGVQPDEDKIQAILKMPPPADKTGVLRIMGMINFIGKFIPNLSARMTNIRRLLYNDSQFQWTEVHEQEWKELKKYLTSEPVLTFYDPTTK